MPEIRDLVVTTENVCKLRRNRRSESMESLPEECFDYCADSQRGSCYTNSPLMWYEAIRTYIIQQQTYNRCEIKKNRDKLISMCRIFMYFPQAERIDLSLNFVTGVVSVKGPSCIHWIKNDFEAIRSLARDVPAEETNNKAIRYDIPEATEGNELEKPMPMPATSDIGTSDTDGSNSDFTLDEELQALWACCTTIKTNLKLLETIIDTHPMHPDSKDTDHLPPRFKDSQHPTATLPTLSQSGYGNNESPSQSPTPLLQNPDPCTDLFAKDLQSHGKVTNTVSNNYPCQLELERLIVEKTDRDTTKDTDRDTDRDTDLNHRPPLSPSECGNNESRSQSPTPLLQNPSPCTFLFAKDLQSHGKVTHTVSNNYPCQLELERLIVEKTDRDTTKDTDLNHRTELILAIDSNTRYLNHERLWTNNGSAFHREIRTLVQLNTFIDVNKDRYPNLKYFFVCVGCSDLESMSGDQVFRGMKQIVEKLRTIFPGIKIILSEITPRMDGLDLQVKAINTLLHQYVEGNDDLFIAHHSNMRESEFFEDRKHFKRSAVDRFAKNIYVALCEAYGKRPDFNEGTELRYDEVANKEAPTTTTPATTADYDYNKYVDKIKPLLYDAELVANLYIRLANKYSTIGPSINTLTEKDEKVQHIHSAQIAYDVIKESSLTNFAHVVSHLLSYLGAIKAEKPIPESASVPNLLTFLEEMVKRNTMTAEHVTMMTCFLARPNRSLLPHHDLRMSFLLTCFKQQISQLNVHTDDRRYLRSCFIKLCEYFVHLDMTLTQQLTRDYLLPHINDKNSTTFIMDTLTYMGLVKSEEMVVTTQDITAPLLLLDFIFVSKRMSLLTSQKLYAFIQLNNPRFKFCSSEREAVANTLRKAIDF